MIGRDAAERDGEYYCPKCGTMLNHFTGLELIPAYLYCPECQDIAYTEEGRYWSVLV